MWPSPHCFLYESGCKDKYFYIFPPNLSALFFKLFFGTAVEESFCRLHPQKMKNTSVKMFQNVRFVSESGCKGKDFFLTSKFFGEKFSSFFSQADLRAVGNYRLAQPTSSPTQGYLHVSIISEAPFSLECGCKSNAIKHTVQIYRALFFKFFTATDIGYIII